MTRPLLIRSGGQSGVDRAALDAALAHGLAVTGWCPAGRWAEDGPIPARYPLVETPEADPADRTRRNVRDSDATLILAPSPLGGGTALTRSEAERLGCPVVVLDPFRLGTVSEAVAWIRSLQPSRGEPLDLNVAGPREGEVPGVYAAALTFLDGMLDRLGTSQSSR